MPTANLCLVCKKEMPVGASKCTECSSFQDWRRFIFAWSGIFAAAFAIAPLWTGAISLWKLAFPEPAKLKLTLGSCKPETVVAYITNTGGTSAMLAQPAVSYLDQSKWRPFAMDFPGDEDDLLAEPQEIDIIKLTPPPAGSFSMQEDGKCRLRVLVPVISAETRSVLQAECTCAV